MVMRKQTRAITTYGQAGSWNDLGSSPGVMYDVIGVEEYGVVFTVSAAAGPTYSIHRSMNYGEGLTLVYSRSAGIRSVAAFSNGVILAGGTDGGGVAEILKSSEWGDSGSWSSKQSFAGESIVNTISILDNVNGIAIAGTHGAAEIWRTTDFGDNWSQVYSVPGNNSIFGSGGFSNGVALACSDPACAVSRSIDWGVTWSYFGNQAVGENGVGKMAINDLQGIAYFGTDNHCHAVRSGDYGATWSDKGVIDPAAVYGWQMFTYDHPTEDIAFLCAADATGKLWRSTDGFDTFQDLGQIGTNTWLTSGYGFSNGVSLVGGLPGNMFQSIE